MGPRCALLALALACAALFWPASSQAFVACSVGGGQLSVSMTARDDSVSFQRFGSQIAVLTGSTVDEYSDQTQILIPCEGGSASVNNVDLVTVQQSPGAALGTVTIDESAGPFAPGATPESDGTSEIEFKLDLAAPLSGALIRGTDASEVFQMGTTPSGSQGVNMNTADEQGVTPDVDVELSGARFIVVFAEGGNDVVTGLGGSGFVGPLRGAFGSTDGGTGNDLLQAGPLGSELIGGPGRDRLLGSRHDDFIIDGAGRDVTFAGRGKDRVFSLDGKRDRVRCGPGKRDIFEGDLLDRAKGCERAHRIRLRKHRGHPGQVIPSAAGISRAWSPFGPRSG
jgi:hypothetical protein